MKAYTHGNSEEFALQINVITEEYGRIPFYGQWHQKSFIPFLKPEIRSFLPVEWLKHPQVRIDAWFREVGRGPEHIDVAIVYERPTDLGETVRRLQECFVSLVEKGHIVQCIQNAWQKSAQLQAFCISTDVEIDFPTLEQETGKEEE